LPVIACGMVGSAQGWREAPYCDTPATRSVLLHSAGCATHRAPVFLRRASHWAGGNVGSPLARCEHRHHEGSERLVGNVRDWRRLPACRSRALPANLGRCPPCRRQ
jgi:hypothetical protein